MPIGYQGLIEASIPAQIAKLHRIIMVFKILENSPEKIRLQIGSTWPSLEVWEKKDGVWIRTRAIWEQRPYVKEEWE